MYDIWDIITDGFPDFLEPPASSSSMHMDRIRKHNIEAYKKRGLALVVRHAWEPHHVDEGLAIPCPVCHQPAYKATADTRCKTCVGRGYIGTDNGEGYADPIFTWGNIILQSEGFDEVQKAGAGSWDKEGGQSSACFSPVLSSDDLVFTVDAFKVDRALAVSGLFQVNGAVDYYTMRGKFTGIEFNTFRLDESLLYQEFNVKAIPRNDIRWGLRFS